LGVDLLFVLGDGDYFHSVNVDRKHASDIMQKWFDLREVVFTKAMTKESASASYILTHGMCLVKDVDGFVCSVVPWDQIRAMTIYEEDSDDGDAWKKGKRRDDE
jgi:hypothetical protein